MRDAECPYCGTEVEINHDDGYGYQEGELHQQECKCGKIFAYFTEIHFTYGTRKAECLNDGEHDYHKTATYPPEFARLRCKMCDDEKPIPTNSANSLTPLFAAIYGAERMSERKKDMSDLIARLHAADKSARMYSSHPIIGTIYVEAADELQAATTRIAELEAKLAQYENQPHGTWISFEDQRPEYDEPVWLLNNEFIYIGGIYDGVDGWIIGKCYQSPHFSHRTGKWYAEIEGDDDYKASHWQPLIAKPSELLLSPI